MAAGGGGRAGSGPKSGPVHAPTRAAPTGPAADSAPVAAEVAAVTAGTPPAMGMPAMRALHRHVGNAAVGRLLREGLPPVVRMELDRPGRPLDAQVRAAMERRFRADFSQVRVHDDDAAASSAKAVRAGAYAVGERVVFGAGRYDPSSPRALRLLAHELAHVLQQRRGGAAGRSPFGDPALEAAADRAADAYVSTQDGHVQVAGASAAGLSLAPEDEPSMADYGRAYQRLRQLEEDSDATARDMHERGVKLKVDRTIGKLRQRSPNLTKQEEDEQRAKLTGLYGGQVTTSAGYQMDDDNRVRKTMSRSGAAPDVRHDPQHGMSAIEKREREQWGVPDDVTWVPGARTRPKDPKDQSTPPAKKKAAASSQGSAAAPVAAAGAGGGGTADRQPPTHVSTFRHAEANHAAHADEHRRLITTGASRPVCPFCVQRLLKSGGTVGTVTRDGIMPADPKDPPGIVRRRRPPDPNVERNVKLLAAEKDRPEPPPGPTVEHRYSGRRGSSGTAGGGTPPATPPPATKATTSGVTKSGATPSATASGKGGPPAAVSTASVKSGSSGAAKQSPSHSPGGGTTTLAKPSSSGQTKASAGPGPAAGTTSQSATATNVRPIGGPTATAGTGSNAALAVAHPVPQAHADNDIEPAPQSGVRLKPQTTTPQADKQAQTPTAVPKPLPPPPTLPRPLPKAPVVSTPAAGSTVVAGVAAGKPRAAAAKPAPPAVVHGGGNAASTHDAASATKPPPAGHTTKSVTNDGIETKQTGQPTTTRKWSGDAGKLGRSAGTSTTDDAGRTVSRNTTTTGTWGGLTRNRVDSDTKGGVGTHRTASTGVTRKDGKLGLGHSVNHETGEFHDDGTLKKGRGRQTSGNAGLLSDDHGAGLFGDITHQQRQVHGNGLATSQSIGASGQFQVRADPIPDTDPKRYKVTLMITLGANASLGAERGRDKSLSATVGGAASVTGSFSHEMSEAEMREYVGTLQRNGAGGAQEEMKIIRLAARGGVDDARKMLAALQQGKLGSASLQPGEEVSLERQGGVQASVGGMLGSQGGPNLGVQVSYSRSRRLKFTRANRNGKMVVTVEVIDATGRGVAAHGSLEFAGGGLEVGDERSVGRSVTFGFAEGDQASLDAALAVDSPQQLDALASRDKAFVLGDTHAHGTTNRSGVSADALGLEFKVNNESGYDESVTDDEAGRTTRVAGHSGGSASFGAKDGPQLKAGESSSVMTEVGPDGKAKGDLNTTTSETTAAGVLNSIKKKLGSPIRSGADAATGGKPVVDSTSESIGMKLSDEDYQAIIASARTQDDGRAWEKAFAGRSNQSRMNWRRLRHEIARVGDDKVAVARALGHYADENDQAAVAVSHVVRPSGSAEGGVRYDFPEGMTEQQETYNALVVGDPLGPAQGLADSGNTQGAISNLTATAAKLDALGAAIQANRTMFTDQAAFAEMGRRVAERSGKIRAKIVGLRAAAQPQPVIGPPTVEQQAEQDAARLTKEQAEHELHQSQAAPLIAALQGSQQNERETFARVAKELDSPPWYRSSDVTKVSQDLTQLKGSYADWDQTVARLKTVLQDDGKDPAAADRYAPDRGTWTKWNNHPEMTKWR